MKIRGSTGVHEKVWGVKYNRGCKGGQSYGLRNLPSVGSQVLLSDLVNFSIGEIKESSDAATRGSQDYEEWEVDERESILVVLPELDEACI